MEKGTSGSGADCSGSAGQRRDDAGISKSLHLFAASWHLTRTFSTAAPQASMRPGLGKLTANAQAITANACALRQFSNACWQLSYRHNLYRFGEANEWSNGPPEPGWASPLAVSGLTGAGRGERLLRASVAHAAVRYFIRWRGGCQRFLAANRWIGNRHALTTVMRGKLMATSSLSRGGAGTRDDCHSDCFACRRRRVLSLAHTARTIGPLPPVQSTTSPMGSWHFESQDGKMELVAPGMSATGVRCQQPNLGETVSRAMSLIAVLHRCRQCVAALCAPHVARQSAAIAGHGTVLRGVRWEG